MNSAQYQEESTEILERHFAILRSASPEVLWRLLPHALICEYVGSSGTKYAVEYWADEIEKDMLRFVVEVFALLDDEWSERLAAGYLVLLPDGEMESGPLEGL